MQVRGGQRNLKDPRHEGVKGRHAAAQHGHRAVHDAAVVAGEDGPLDAAVRQRVQHGGDVVTKRGSSQAVFLLLGDDAVQALPLSLIGLGIDERENVGAVGHAAP